MRVVDPACAGDSHNRWLNFWGARQVHQWKNGELIDSYDIVARFNRSVVDGIEEVVGSRTDIIVANDANRLSKARSPEFTSKPKCVVTYVNTAGIGNRTDEQKRGFFEWIANTPLFLSAGPEVMCCDIPKRKRAFTMGTYAVSSLPYFLNLEKLLVTGFTMFGQSGGGSDHYSKKSTRSSCTWHDADLEAYVMAQVLGNMACELQVTDEVAELMEREGFSANRVNGAEGTKVTKEKKGVGIFWYGVGRLSKLCLMLGFQLRRVAEKQVYKNGK